MLSAIIARASCLNKSYLALRLLRRLSGRWVSSLACGCFVGGRRFQIDSRYGTSWTAFQSIMLCKWLLRSRGKIFSSIDLAVGKWKMKVANQVNNIRYAHFYVISSLRRLSLKASARFNASLMRVVILYPTVFVVATKAIKEMTKHNCGEKPAWVAKTLDFHSQFVKSLARSSHAISISEPPALHSRLECLSGSREGVHRLASTFQLDGPRSRTPSTSWNPIGRNE